MDKKTAAIVLLSGLVFYSSTIALAQEIHPINSLKLEDARIDDPFWSPRLKVWRTKTVNDVFDKLEGKYDPDRKDIIEEKAKMGRTRDAFLNFDRVAKGEKDVNEHDGPPWYDGLVYESMRGAADLLMEYPDPALEKRMDGYVDRIAAAQAVDPDGYLNTYTTMTRSHQRWGTNGGDDVWQHDLYNAALLTDAAAHYYRATGKTKFLDVAVKLANYMCREMGTSPKKNVIPGHGGPEEAMVKLYWLFRDNPDLKKKMSVPVDEHQYYALAKFWIEDRGNYGEGAWSRKSDKAYNQDQESVFQQKTIEGHAVRATLLATGVTAVAKEEKDPRYITTANNYWNNMAGKRMFITGGEGAIAEDERFGADYFLPESAYLETCAAIGAGFFSQRMNELQGDGKYMDEFERILYNNLLSGISLSGDHYHYENPLTAKDHVRWSWHSCPCCPPMFLKMVSILPSYIYAQDGDAAYVNLFIGSEGKVKLKNADVTLKQTTEYPWKGKTLIEVNPASSAEFAVNIRIPGWSQGKENPFDLYKSTMNDKVSLKVNGKDIPHVISNGYSSLKRTWKRGDVIELNLPLQPRMVYPNEAVETVKNKVAIASGPLLYGLEGNDNAGVLSYSIKPSAAIKLLYKPGLLGGVNIITGQATGEGKTVTFTAIPFFALGNRGVFPYTVWLPVK